MKIAICFLTLLGLFFGLSLLVVRAISGGPRPRVFRAVADFRTRRRATRAAPPSLLRDEAVSDIPALNRVLSSWSLFERVPRLLDQADLHVRPATLALTALVLAGLAAWRITAWQTTAPLPLVLMGATAAATLPAAFVLHTRRRRFAQFEAQFPEALAMMAGALLAGNALSEALARVARELKGPVAAEFRKTFAEQALGADLAVALDHLSERMPLDDVHFFTAAVRLQREAGGNLAELFYSLSDTIRVRFQIRRQVATLSAEGRLTGKILTFMPLAVGLLMYFGNRDYLSLFWTEKIGRLMLWTLVGCQLCGTLLIRKLVRIRV